MESHLKPHLEYTHAGYLSNEDVQCLVFQLVLTYLYYHSQELAMWTPLMG